MSNSRRGYRDKSHRSELCPDGGTFRLDMSTDTDTLDPNQASKDLRNFDFSGRDLSDFDFSHTDLRGANFSHCTLHAANFSGADIRGTVFTGASFYDPAFREAFIEDPLNPRDKFPRWTWHDEHCECYGKTDDDGNDLRCSDFQHFADERVNKVWERPESNFMGVYLIAWNDNNALERVIEMFYEDRTVDGWTWRELDFESTKFIDVIWSINWSRWAHNEAAFFLSALHDETTVWPDQEHLDDFPYWNQPNRVDWSLIGVFVDE